MKDQMTVAESPKLEELFRKVEIMKKFTTKMFLFYSVSSFYYRGIDKKASVLTFDQATLYIPLLLVAIWLLPTILCSLFFSVKLNSRQSWRDRPILNIVLFIFSTVTNIVYHNQEPAQRNKSEVEDENIRSVSMIVETRDIGSEDAEEDSEEDEVNYEPSFSLVHSNVLFCVSLLSTTLLISLDILYISRDNSRK